MGVRFREQLFLSVNTAGKRMGKSNIALHVAVVLLVGVIPKTSATDEGCPEGFERLCLDCKSCYKFVKEKEDYYGAVYECDVQDYRYYLLEIDNAEEQFLIEAVLKDYEMDSVWTAGTCPYGGDKWLWTRYKLGPYRAWAPGYPKIGPASCGRQYQEGCCGTQTEKHLCLELRKSEGFKWTSERCKVKNQYVCEYNPDGRVVNDW
ncbi:hypothetical protein BsWGS_24815 [Bradybaena similaris]